MAVRELLRVPTSIPLVVDKEDEGTISIKGFASVEVPDRSNDVVPPTEFNVAQFMAAPTMLVNHKYWRDYSGNDVAVGRPEELVAVKLAPGDEENWNVVDLKTGETVSTYPKSKVPNLKKGDRGLFIRATVTEPEVVERVKRGEYGAFSWRGLSTVEYRVNKTTNLTERVLTDIDLYEISLVNIADQPASTFIVGKDGKIEAPLAVNAIRLDKTRFETAGAVSEYLKSHHLEFDRVREDGNSFMALQRSHSDFDLEKLVTVKLANGVHVVAGPLKEPVRQELQPMSKADVDKLVSMFSSRVGKEKTMADEEKAQPQADESKTEEQKAAEKKAADQANALDRLGDTIAAKTVSSLKPLLEGVSKGLEGVSGTLKLVAEKMAGTVAEKETEKETDAETKTETFKTVEDSLNTLAQGILDQGKQIMEISKTVDALKGTTPASNDHHKEEVSKSKDDDPNSVLDGLFPFLG